MSEQTPLDPEVIEALRELADEEDPDFLKDLLLEYITSTHCSLEDLSQAINSEDEVTVVKTAHTLKGASGNIGAPRIATLFRQLEELGKKDELSEAAALMSSIADEFQIVKSEIAKEVS